MAIITKNSGVTSAAPTPSQLLVGELAVNTEDGNLYTKSTDGSVKRVATASVKSISELVSKSAYGVVNVLNYHSDLEGGGGVFYWDATGNATEHNGGTVISPLATFPTDWNNQTQLATWFDGSALVGTGVWRRQYDGAVDVKWFGAKNPTDNNEILQAVDASFLSGDPVLFRSVVVSSVPTLGDIVAKMHEGEIVKIACYGDSTTDGNETTGWTANPTSGGVPVGVEDHESTAPNAWPAKLKSILREMFGNNNIDVFNAGYSGQRLWDGWAYNNYDKAITENPFYGTPDVCFIGFGLNDITAATNIYKEHLRYTIALCLKMIKAGTLPILLTCDPIQRNDPNSRTSEEAGRVADSAKRDAARMLNIPIFEVDKPMRKWASSNSSGYNWSTLQPDSLHFGDLGHAFKAAFIATQLNPDIIYAEKDLTVTAQDPRWQLNDSLTWGTYNTSYPASGRNYFTTGGEIGDELMVGWVWNDSKNAYLSGLFISHGGSSGSVAGSVTALEMTDKQTNIKDTKIFNNGDLTVSEQTEYSSDRRLTIEKLPVGLSKILLKRVVGGVSAYSCDLMFGVGKLNHGSLSGLAFESSVMPDSTGWFNYMPEQYYDDHAPDVNRYIEVDCDWPEQSGIILYHTRGFNYSSDRKQKTNLHVFRNSTSVFLNYAGGSEDGDVDFRYKTLVNIPLTSFPSVNGDNYRFRVEFLLALADPLIKVYDKDGNEVMSTSIYSLDAPISGWIGGLMKRSISLGEPRINTMSFGKV
jgi:lysophospholipase L1-like esterase